ncbi:DUF1722 domain-containing protein [Klebsiella pneumoniae]
MQHPLSRHLARSAHHLSRTASAVDRRYTMKRILTLGLALLMLILAPLTLLKHYLAEYPDRYLQAQNYFDPYPQDLALRLTVN